MSDAKICDDRWISANEAARVTCLPRTQIRAVAALGRLTVRDGIGPVPPRYSLRSCEILRDALIKPARNLAS